MPGGSDVSINQGHPCRSRLGLTMLAI